MDRELVIVTDKFDIWQFQVNISTNLVKRAEITTEIIRVLSFRQHCFVETGLEFGCHVLSEVVF
jgi:hypothetical protein